MQNASGAITRFLARVRNGDLHEVVCNPLDIRVGEQLLAYGLKEEQFLVESIAEVAMQVGTDWIRTVNYTLRPQGKEGAVYSLRISPIESVTENEWEHDCAVLLSLVGNIQAANCEKVASALTDSSDTLNDKFVGGAGAVFSRLGTDRDGYECKIFEIRDTDGDGKAEHSEARQKTNRQWVFYRRSTDTVPPEVFEALFSEATVEGEDGIVQKAQSVNQAVLGPQTIPPSTSSKLEFLFIEQDGPQSMKVYRGIRIPLMAIETR